MRGERPLICCIEAKNGSKKQAENFLRPFYGRYGGPSHFKPFMAGLFSSHCYNRPRNVETLREFFRAFKFNFKNGFLYGLIALFAAAVIYADGIFAFSQEGSLKIVFCIVTGIVAAVYLTYICYIFALQAQFENSFIAHIKNTFLLAFVAPGQTVLMWIVLAAPVLVILLLPEYIVAYIGFIFILFGISFPVYLNSKILIKIFSRFIPSEEPDEKERIIE